MHLSQADIEKTDRVKRLNLINSLSGIKPAHLIGTRSKDGFENLGVFSNVVHLGSNPALLGIIFRPQHEKPRDTYLNIKDSHCFTLNAVSISHAEQAHFTSAKFPKEVSEFDRCKFTSVYYHDFVAPYVQESQLKIGLEKVEEIKITSNQTILLVGRIMHLYFPEAAMDKAGRLNLSTLDLAGVSGLDTYYRLEKVQQFPYAHLKYVPEF